MSEVLLDSLFDTLKLLPFLLLLYVLIELLEHKTAMGRPSRALSGKFAPLIGSATGLVPMCGFSVMASKLYERKFLTIGTLFSVFIATSDEALLVLLLSAPWKDTSLFVDVLIMCAVKLVFGAGVGYLLDLLAKKLRGTAFTLCPQDATPHGHLHGHAHGKKAHEKGHEEAHGDGESEEPHACEHRHESKLTLYLFSPLLHALEVSAAVFLFNLAFGGLLEWIGTEKVVGFLAGKGYWYQPLIACFVGMIPNCASSVVLAEVYAAGGIAFGSCLGGLVTNAGLGVLVLFRNLKAWKRNLAVLAGTFVLGIAVAYAVNAFALLI